MATQLPLRTDYQAVRAQLEGAIQQNLLEEETKALAKHKPAIADDLHGSYLTDTARLMSLFTPELFSACVENYDGGTAEYEFFDSCIQEMNEEIAYLALVAWPNVVGKEGAWSALSLPLEQQWSDKVSIKDDDDEEDDDEPFVDLIMLSANFTDRKVYEEYSKHILVDGGTDFEGLLANSFFVPETSYAEFRAELEAREGISEVIDLGEAVGIPSGEVTQKVREATRRLFSTNQNTDVLPEGAVREAGGSIVMDF